MNVRKNYLVNGGRDIKFVKMMIRFINNLKKNNIFIGNSDETILSERLRERVYHFHSIVFILNVSIINQLD